MGPVIFSRDEIDDLREWRDGLNRHREMLMRFLRASVSIDADPMTDRDRLINERLPGSSPEYLKAISALRESARALISMIDQQTSPNPRLQQNFQVLLGKNYELIRMFILATIQVDSDIFERRRKAKQ